MTKCVQCQNHFHTPITITNFYKKEPRLCPSCAAQWDACKIDHTNRCPRCLKLLAEGEQECLDCAFLAERFTLMHQLYCDYQYDGHVKALIQQYKFMRDVALSECFAQQLQLPREKYDYLVPIPSPYERDRERTFNPVRQLLQQKGIYYHELLTTKLLPKQSELSKIKRAHLENPFELKGEEDMTDKSILLIDDIYTTGMTVHHAGEILYDRNIRKFDVLTLAR